MYTKAYRILVNNQTVPLPLPQKAQKASANITPSSFLHTSYRYLCSKKVKQKFLPATLLQRPVSSDNNIGQSTFGGCDG